MTIDEAIKWEKEVAKDIREIDSDIVQKEIDCDKKAKEHEQVAEWLEELKEYQQYKKQGFLVLLPCKPGTIVYAVYKLTIGNRNKFIYDIEERIIKLEDIDCIGESVFFTREDALKKIIELKSRKR